VTDGTRATTIAVVADTHMPRGSRRLPDACAERLRASDLVLHAGDLVGRAFLEELHAFGPPVVAVRGNMDEPALASLPPRTVVALGPVRIGMLHDPGARPGREDRLVRTFGSVAAVVYGHTHLPQVERHRGVWILNPGSPTERRRAPTRSMLELKVRGDELVPRLVELGA
jgi:hypothetical protein